MYIEETRDDELVGCVDDLGGVRAGPLERLATPIAALEMNWRRFTIVWLLLP